LLPPISNIPRTASAEFTDTCDNDNVTDNALADIQCHCTN